MPAAHPDAQRSGEHLYPFVLAGVHVPGDPAPWFEAHLQLEEFATGEAFGALLARTAENAAAMTSLWADSCDAVLRSFRFAGRKDVARLGARIAQTDDKLERVLQELYAVQEALAAKEES